jgi:DNA-binding CsgD family transcriptional regulator
MRQLLLLLPLVFTALLSSQELPPIVSFEMEDYHAGSQNWKLSQDKNQFIYAANNQGLLEYNGQRWTLYPSPGEAIFRSVKAIGNRVYTGSYMDFGVWERDDHGVLVYESISNKIKDLLINDEQFWNILPFGDYIIFQSLNQFILYQPSTKGLSAIVSPGGIDKAFVTRDRFYFTDAKHRLFELASGAIQPLLADNAPAYPIVHIWEDREGILLQTSSSGTFRLEDGRLKPDARHPFLKGCRIYSATSLRLGGLAFGTISNGVYILTPEGKLRYHLNQENGLTNNTILSLYEDTKNNLWAGADNGISYINLSSPFLKYTDKTGQLGTVHASAVHEGRLYLGSNQGLFEKQLHSEGDFNLVPGTRGQVWSLFNFGESLFCGHDKGTFIVSQRRVQPIFTDNGTWEFHSVEGRPNLLLQGHYNGLTLLEFTPKGWRYRNKIEGFDYSARFFEMKEDNEIYISHEYKGIFGLKLDEDYRRVVSLKEYETPAKGKNAGLSAFGDSLIYYSKEGMFTLRNFDQGFHPSANLNLLLQPEEYTSGNMTRQGNQLWFFTNRSISSLHPGALTDDLQRQTIPVPADLVNAKPGYENISAIGADSLLIGTSDGYLVLARSAVPLHQHELHLTQVRSKDRKGTTSLLPVTGAIDIPFSVNNISFEFSVPAYSKYFISYFQFRLKGFKEEWSPLIKRPDINYPNLPYGNYTLEVRSLLGRRASENILSYSFQVLRPWYASYLALSFYFLGGTLLVYLFHRTYTRYYRRKQGVWQEENERKIAAQQRETELTLSKVANQQLEQDITSKNREMALSTMNLVKKNELLQQIKASLLAKNAPEKNIQEVIKTIDQTLDESETWNLFKDAFENADRDFFKKAKALHPELTPNDLKLCAYLRLNLSSKEIAPMLNISVRSVEVKRYRLRKKMGLEREAGLVEYILGL